MSRWGFKAIAERVRQLAASFVVRIRRAKLDLPDAFRPAPAAIVSTVRAQAEITDIPPHVLPEFRLTFDAPTPISPVQCQEWRGRIHLDLARLVPSWFPVTDAFIAIWKEGEPWHDFQIEFHEGSIVIRVRFASATMALALCSYGCGHSKATTLGNDLQQFSDVVTQAVYTAVRDSGAEEKSPPEAMLGSIVDLDTALSRTEQGQGGEGEFGAAITNLRPLRDARSESAKTLVAAIDEYVDARYGRSIDWNDSEAVIGGRGYGLARILGVPVTKHSDRSILFTIVKVEIDTTNTTRRPTDADFRSRAKAIVRDELRTLLAGVSVAPPDEEVKIVEHDSGVSVYAFWTISTIVAIVIGYGKFRTGVEKSKADVDWALRRIQTGLASLFAIPPRSIRVDAPSFARFNEFLATIGEGEMSHKKFELKAARFLARLSDRREKRLIRAFVDDYVQRKFFAPHTFTELGDGSLGQ